MRRDWTIGLVIVALAFSGIGGCVYGVASSVQTRLCGPELECSGNAPGECPKPRYCHS